MASAVEGLYGFASVPVRLKARSNETISATPATMITPPVHCAYPASSAPGNSVSSTNPSPNEAT